MNDVNKSMSHRASMIILGAFLGLLAILACFPFVYMLLLSFTNSTSLRFALSDVHLDFVNYKDVFEKTKFIFPLKNSVIVAFFTCLINALFCSMAAYGLEKKRFAGSKGVFALYMATLAVPGQVTMIPVFLMMRDMNLMNTYFALICPSVDAFGVFLIKQFMSSVPDELIEAGQIDGAGEIYTFTKIVIPLIKPALVSLTVFTFISAWNGFLWPLVICSDSKMQTLPVALSLLKGKFDTNYGLVMAGSTLTFIFPFLLYAFLQKQFVEGIALSGVKG